MQYRPAVVVLAAASLLFIAGCGSGPPAAESAAPVDPDANQNAEGYPVRIENCGRILTFDGPPSRVVTGYQPVLEVMAGLGLTDHVIGRSTYEGALLPEQAAEIEDIPVVSNSTYLPASEALVALAPDFVYSTGYSDFDASAGRATVEDLAAIGTQVYIGGGACTPDESVTATLEDTYADITNIGRIFGVPERAAAAVERMTTTVAQAREKVAGEPEVRVAFYSAGTGPLRLAGAGLNSDIVRLAGGRNVFADQEVYFEAGQEAVAGAGVDTFVISDYQPGMTAAAKAEFLSSTFPDIAAGWPHPWPTIDAVYTHPGWRHADSIALLASQLHPEAFQ